MVHAGMTPPGAYRLVQRVVAAGGAELLTVARAEALDCGVVEQDFADRPQHEFIKCAGRALRQRIEASQALERIAKKIETDRLRGSSRKQIDDATTNREIAGRPAPTSTRARRTDDAAALAATAR